jgi:predicted nucleic acid-binding protein
MNYLLDTNVHSELRRDDRANPVVLEWAAKYRLEDVFLSAITLLEIELGVLRLTRRDPEQSKPLRAWIEKTLQDFAGRIIPIDAEVALRCAALHVPNPRPDRDAYIAATALVHDLTVVTRNTRDFEGTGVKLLNPWISAS